MLYRLITENKRKKWLYQLIGESFMIFTTYEVEHSLFKNKKSLCIEIYSDSPAADVMLSRICKAICGYNKQNYVIMDKIMDKLDVDRFYVDSAGII